MSNSIQQYGIITLGYWAFTITDGALRMLVLLYFYQLGYSPIALATLFLLYEFFGVVTNLFGGWLGARWGLNRTMVLGQLLQVIALAALLIPTSLLTIGWVMAAQAISGIAKDLNKMSAKSGIKSLVKDSVDGHKTLYSWISWLTGSKNALKGAGFFVGGGLLQWLGFQGAILVLLFLILLALMLSAIFLKTDMGKASYKPKFKDIFSSSQMINRLSLARLFLFASRDIWFVIALPVLLASQFHWSHSEIGGFFALWIMGYGVIQGMAPMLTSGSVASPGKVMLWTLPLVSTVLVLAVDWVDSLGLIEYLLLALGLYAIFFAIISSMHSALIVQWARQDGVSLDVGFYYMSNASGRLLGTMLSGLVYELYGLSACLFISAFFLAISVAVTLGIGKNITEQH